MVSFSESYSCWYSFPLIDLNFENFFILTRINNNHNHNDHWSQGLPSAQSGNRVRKIPNPPNSDLPVHSQMHNHMIHLTHFNPYNYQIQLNVIMKAEKTVTYAAIKCVYILFSSRALRLQVSLYNWIFCFRIPI